MKRTLRITTAVLGMAVAGWLIAGTIPPFAAMAASAQTTVADQRAMFAIENMTCALCPVTVKAAMAKVAGVKSVTIDFAAKTATVVFDSSQASLADIAAASTNAGYPAHATKG